MSGSATTASTSTFSSNRNTNDGNNNNDTVLKQMLGSQQGIRPQGSLQPSSSDATSATSGTNAGNASPNTRMQNEVDRTNAMATERLKSLLFSRSSTGTSAKADVGPPKSSLLLQHLMLLMIMEIVVKRYCKTNYSR